MTQHTTIRYPCTTDLPNIKHAIHAISILMQEFAQTHDGEKHWCLSVKNVY